MKELSIFVDESGTYSTPEDHNSYYLVSFIFHDQNNTITDQITEFDRTLKECNFNIEYFHSSPIVRAKEIFKTYSLDDRRKLFYKMLNFYNHCNISHTTFKIKRTEAEDAAKLSSKLAKEIKYFIEDYISYFKKYDRIIVYYDYGQSSLGILLNATLSLLLNNTEFRRVEQPKYKLLQMADFVCYLNLLKIKQQEKRLSVIERKFFYKPSELNKTFLKSLNKKTL